jgi:hypothetical protein
MSECGCSPLGPGGCGEPLLNALWVNALFTGVGNGSPQCPFNTPAKALAVVPAGASATIVLSPADYSATPALAIVDRNITFECLGGPSNGTRTPRARAVLPAITFNASAPATDPLVFAAKSCDLTAGLTVNVAVDATLEDCSSVWTDAGKLSTVRTSGFPEVFNGAPQQTINGSVGAAVLEGMGVQSLTATSIVSSRGWLRTGGTGFVATSGVVLYEHEFDPAVVITGSDVFFDLWSWYQVNEAPGVITGRVSTQELSPLTWNWGCQNFSQGQFLNPGIKFGNGAASPSPSDWYCVPRDCRAFDFHAQLAAVIGNNLTLTLFAGATLGTIATTGYSVTITAGQLAARNVLAPAGTPIVLPANRFMAIQVSGLGAPVSGNSVDVLLTAM